MQSILEFSKTISTEMPALERVWPQNYTLNYTSDAHVLKIPQPGPNSITH